MSGKIKEVGGKQTWIGTENIAEIRKLSEHIKTSTTIDVSQTKLINAAVTLGLPELKRKHGLS